LAEGDLFFEASSHPNICRMFGFFNDPDTNKHGIILEYFRDHSVLESFFNGVEFKMSQRYQICRQLSHGVLHLHRKGVIHADIALRNVLIDLTQFRVAITDFGLSRRLGDISKTKTISPRWSAPELCESHIPNMKSDIWAYGITCIEVMTNGRLPFDTLSTSEVLEQLKESELRPKIAKSWDESFKRVLNVCFLSHEMRWTAKKITILWQDCQCSMGANPYESKIEIPENDWGDIAASSDVSNEPNEERPEIGQKETCGSVIAGVIAYE